LDRDKAEYVVRYYSHLMTKQESLAHRHLIGTVKLTHGRSDEAAQAEARNKPKSLRELLSDDPEVLNLAREGYERFVMRTAERIFNQHSDDIVLNCCSKCGALGRTPNLGNAVFAFMTGIKACRTGRSGAALLPGATSRLHS
jgi:hypothetical protein